MSDSNELVGFGAAIARCLREVGAITDEQADQFEASWSRIEKHNSGIQREGRWRATKLRKDASLADQTGLSDE